MSNCTKNVVLATNQNNGSFGGEGVFDCFYHSPPTYLQWVKATLLRKLWWPKCHLVQLTLQLTLYPISSIYTQLSMNGNRKYSHATANHISKRKMPNSPFIRSVAATGSSSGCWFLSAYSDSICFCQ